MSPLFIDAISFTFVVMWAFAKFTRLTIKSLYQLTLLFMKDIILNQGSFARPR